MVDVTINDDYAVLTVNKFNFYYGYEFSKKICDCGETEEIWGFEATSSDNRWGISYDEMSKYKNCPSQWECDKCLLFGIGLFLRFLLENKIDEGE